LHDAHGNTALHLAVVTTSPQRLAILQFLLTQEPVLDTTNQFGFTPLHLAFKEAKGGKEKQEILNSLWAAYEERGADFLRRVLAMQDQSKRIPLHYAVREGELYWLKRLTAAGSSLETADKEGLTPLHYAIKGGHSESAAWLLEQKVNVHAKDSQGNQPLQGALTFPDPGKAAELVVLLLGKGAVLTKADLMHPQTLSTLQIVLQQPVKAQEAERHYQQGCAHLQQQQFPLAIAAFEHALHSKPDFLPAHHARHEAQLQQRIQVLQADKANTDMQTELARRQQKNPAPEQLLIAAQKALSQQAAADQAQRTEFSQKKQELEQLQAVLKTQQQFLEEKQQTLDTRDAQTMASNPRVSLQRREAQLFTQQHQLDKEKLQLQRDQQTLQEKYQAMQWRFDYLEQQHQLFQTTSQHEANKLDQLQTSLQTAQHDLMNREKECHGKLKLLTDAQQHSRQIEQQIKEKEELLTVQLRIFQAHGLSPKEYAFRQLLSQLKSLFKTKGIAAPRCFISYAWEDRQTPDGNAANERLQQWLARLEKDLEKLGITVFLDIKKMQGNLRDTMAKNIQDSDYFLLIGTPRFKQRIAFDDQDQPTTNVAYEFSHIWAKRDPQLNNLLPILYEGNVNSSFPAQLATALIRDARLADSYHNLLVDTNPLGLLPVLYQLPTAPPALRKEYEACLQSFKNRVQNHALEMKLAHADIQQTQVGLPVSPGNAYQQHGLFGTTPPPVGIMAAITPPGADNSPGSSFIV
jgi:ankyrin repeat protein